MAFAQVKEPDVDAPTVGEGSQIVEASKAEGYRINREL